MSAVNAPFQRWSDHPRPTQYARMFVPGVSRETATRPACLKSSIEPLAMNVRRSNSIDAVPPPSVLFTSRATIQVNHARDNFDMRRSKVKGQRSEVKWTFDLV